MSSIKELKKVIDKVRETSPVLLCGGAVAHFKKAYKGKILSVRDLDELREVINYYSTVKYLDSILVLDGISFLNQRGIALLLKFVEESRFPLILLAQYDNIDAILLSRMKYLVKYPLEETKSEFMGSLQGSQKIADQLSEDSHYLDKVRYQGYYSPKLYALEKTLGKVRNKEKILNIIG